MKKWLLLSIVYCMTTLVNAAPLPASQVFQLDVKKIDPNTFAIQWQIKNDYFLYSDRIKLVPQSDSNARLGALRFPPSMKKTDKQGHTYTIYRNHLSIPVAVLGENPGEALLTLHYQGCADDGFCYPPETKQIKITIDDHLELSAVNLEQSENEVALESSALPQDEISQIFTSHYWITILLIFFGFGLLLSFTPCVLPMVPVLSGIIVGHGKDVTTKKAFLLSLSYVLSMSITYAIFGAVIAKLGANLQISMQSPWAISIFSIIFVLLALSMFGFYEFKLPNSWQSKIAGSSNDQRRGHFLGAAVMGCLSTLILSPCVTAPLIGVLTYIAQTGNVLLGSLTLFFLSLGMGTPLLLIGTSAGKWLPASGQWMNTIKAFFGILFIVVAIYLMERIIPVGITMALWSSLLVFCGIYTGALSYANTSKEQFCQGAGLIMLIYGILILIGASMGSSNPLQPLMKLQSTQNMTVPYQTNQPQTLDLIKQKINEAKGKPIMLDFYADWCASCKLMEATTFKDPQVLKALEQFTVIKVDITTNNAATKAIMNAFQVIAPPTFIFYNAQGEQLSEKLVGEYSAKEFAEHLDQIISP